MNRIKKFLTSSLIVNNLLIIVYFFLTIIFELLGVLVTAHKFYIRSPFIFINVVLLICAILFFIRSNTARYIVIIVVLGLQGVMNLGFIVLYEMTGQIFDYTMLELRQDAWGMLESIPINFTYFAVYGLLYSLFIVYIGRFVYQYHKLPSVSKLAIKCSVSIVCVLGFMTVSVATSLNHTDFYDKLLYSKDDKSYNDLGVIGNTISTLVSGATKQNVEIKDAKALSDYIFDSNEIHISNFAQNSLMKYNVVTVLCESFEWMAIIEDLDRYPNGLNLTTPDGYDESVSPAKLLFPNLYEFYEESLVMTNFHSKEKTDISENYSYLGAYPTNAITNYDFYENSYPTSMANMLKTIDPSIKTQIFHNGTKDFYNRDEYEIAVGFDKFYATEDMVELGMYDWNSNNAERNLDGDMIDTCADLMFPTDSRFFTYIISITQHGQYTYRNNLAEKGYYDKLMEFGMECEGDETYEAFVTYIAAALELDSMIGKLNQELESRGLADKTIVTLFGDHNCYYAGLSNYVKNIQTFEQAQEDGINYVDLYNVPLMIRVPGMEHQLIDKFMATSDILPTLLDLLGINYYKNVYYGNSAFDDEESVLYSRAYNFFCTNDLFFTSLEKVKFAHNGAQMTDDVINRTKKLVKKIEMNDLIFYNDFFAMNIEDLALVKSKADVNTYGDCYRYQIRSINGLI